jgi:iron complex transport system substrate-binding protein
MRPVRFRLRFLLAAVWGCLALWPGREGLFAGEAEEGDARRAEATLVLDDNDASVTFRDATGDTVVLNKRPRRVAVCFPSLVSAWYLAGGEAVAIPSVASGETLPPGARDLPAVGRFNNPNPERVLALDPDLALLAGKMEKHVALREILRTAGIASALVRYDNYDDFVATMDLFCRLNGKTPAETPEAARIFAEVDALCARARVLPSPRFISLFASGAGFSAEGDAAHTPCMALKLGGVNTARAVRGNRLKFSLERLIMDDPEVILVITMGDPDKIKDTIRAEWESQPAWRELSAVRGGRVHFLPRSLFLYVPADHFPDAFRHLASLLYPDQDWNDAMPPPTPDEGERP